MAKLTIEIELDNDAFQGSDLELVAVFRAIAIRVEENGTDYLADMKVYDSNGNKVGVCTLESTMGNSDAFYDTHCMECEEVFAKCTCYDEKVESSGISKNN